MQGGIYASGKIWTKSIKYMSWCNDFWQVGRKSYGGMYFKYINEFGSDQWQKRSMQKLPCHVMRVHLMLLKTIYMQNIKRIFKDHGFKKEETMSTDESSRMVSLELISWLFVYRARYRILIGFINIIFESYIANAIFVQIVSFHHF